MYADPHSCHNFYKCTNGTLTYEECGHGLLFDPARAFAGAVHNHCHYNWAVTCGERSEEEIQPRWEERGVEERDTLETSLVLGGSEHFVVFDLQGER